MHDLDIQSHPPAINSNSYGIDGTVVLHYVGKLLLISNCRTVDGNDKVAAQSDGNVAQIRALRPAMEAGTIRGASRHYLNDQQPRAGGKAHLIGQIRPDGNGSHAESGKASMAQVNQIVKHRFRRVDGNGKADAGALLRSAGQDHGVDADDLPPRVQERATRVAGIDSGIRLNGLVDESPRSAHRANRADDAARHCAAQSKGIADGKYFLSHHQAF